MLPYGTTSEGHGFENTKQRQNNVKTSSFLQDLPDKTSGFAPQNFDKTSSFENQNLARVHSATNS